MSLTIFYIGLEPWLNMQNSVSTLDQPFIGVANLTHLLIQSLLGTQLTSSYPHRLFKLLLFTTKAEDTDGRHPSFI